MEPSNMQQLITENDNLVNLIKGKSNSFYSINSISDNMVSGDDFLIELGNTVVEEFKSDVSSRADWEAKVAQQLKLFASIMPKKNDPWEGCSNVNLPFITIAVIQFQARAFDALLPSKGIVNVVATGDEDVDRSERVSKHMNYQLLYEMEDFEENVDKMLMQEAVVGSVFKKSFYDPIRKINRSVIVSAADFVVDYYAKSIEDAKRKTHVLYLTRNDIRKRVLQGIFIDDAWDLGPGTKVSVNATDIKDAIDSIMGISSSNRHLDIPRIVLEQHRYVDINSDGIEEACVVTVDYETQKVLRIVSREYVNEFKQVQELEYFTHYQFLPSPEGFYGIGYGTLLQGLNESANTIVNEVIDAGSLANRTSGFVSKRSGVKKGELSFSMGEFKEVDTYIDDIRKSIFTFDFKGPNQTLYATLGLLYEYAKLVTSISETMTGQMPASDTPASTVLALLEEGRKVFSAIHKRNHRAFKKELRKLYRLNFLYLDESKYFKILGDNVTSQQQTIPIGRLDYAGEVDIIPVSDPTIISRAEQVMKAKEVLNIVLTSPITAGNQELIFNATKHYLEALDVKGISKFLMPSAPPPDVDQVNENAEILAERSVNALPQQDHLHHLDVLAELFNGPFANELTPIAKRIAERHRLDHVSLLYLSEKKGSISNE